MGVRRGHRAQNDVAGRPHAEDYDPQDDCGSHWCKAYPTSFSACPAHLALFLHRLPTSFSECLLEGPEVLK